MAGCLGFRAQTLSPKQAGDLAGCLDSMAATPGVVLLRVTSTLSAASDAASHAGFRVYPHPPIREREREREGGRERERERERATLIQRHTTHTRARKHMHTQTQARKSTTPPLSLSLIPSRFSGFSTLHPLVIVPSLTNSARPATVAPGLSS